MKHALVLIKGIKKLRIPSEGGRGEGGGGGYTQEINDPQHRLEPINHLILEGKYLLYLRKLTNKRSRICCFQNALEQITN